MTGFCSCKTGIHAIDGNNLSTAPQTRAQYDIDGCEHGGGHAKLIASIGELIVIAQVLNHLKLKVAKTDTANQQRLPPERASPRTLSLFDRYQSRLFD